MKPTHQFIKDEYTYTGVTTEAIIGLFPDISTFVLPIAIVRDVEHLLRYKKSYSIISNNQTEAIEKCLYFLSNLTSTVFREDNNYWKSLHSKILDEQLRNNKDNTYIYRKIVKFLNNNNIIEIKSIEGVETYQVGEKTKQYKLNDKYIRRRVMTYNIKSKSIINIKTKIFYKTFNESLKNPICNNLIQLYPYINIPTDKEIIIEAKRLIKEGYKTKKGKILTMKNKNDKSKWKDSDNRSFVEESLELFNYLTSRGFMVPSPGSVESGGRIVDSFSLMPSWIRKMITVNGNKLIEADYSTLHPNITKKIYNGTYTHINHDIVAKELGIDRQIAKIEHLSFFNKRWSQMEKSPLFKYYMVNEPNMMADIRNEKENFGYKMTSKRLFTAEVELMTEVVIKLNSVGINALYVYDALYVEPKDIEITTKIMNECAINNNINTTV